MYDSGGISLKPRDAVHATMKNDMSGRGARPRRDAALARLGCTTRRSTGYLCAPTTCRPAPPCSSVDVLTIRGGTTVEVLNTDAEGRLVMADGLVLATEAGRRRHRRHRHPHRRRDADLRRRRSRRSSATTKAWSTQVTRRRRRGPTSRSGSCRSSGATARQLDSTIADIKNMGGDERRRRSPRRCSSRSSWAACRAATSTSAGTTHDRDRRLLAVDGAHRVRHAPARRAGARVPAAGLGGPEGSARQPRPAPGGGARR